ncbi:hypothetical protein [Flexivirga sp. B27]
MPDDISEDMPDDTGEDIGEDIGEDMSDDIPDMSLGIDDAPEPPLPLDPHAARLTAAALSPMVVNNFEGMTAPWIDGVSTAECAGWRSRSANQPHRQHLPVVSAP